MNCVCQQQMRFDSVNIGFNWAMHRAYYIDLLKKGWPLKAAYDEAVRYTNEQEALSVTREVTA